MMTIYFSSVLYLLCFRARMFIDALWSPAGKGLTSLLSFVMSTCEVVSIHVAKKSGKLALEIYFI